MFLTDKKNTHLLDANCWIRPFYQELLHAAFGNNASVEGERKRPCSGLAASCLPHILHSLETSYSQRDLGVLSELIQLLSLIELFFSLSSTLLTLNLLTLSLFYAEVYAALKFIIAFTTRPTGFPLLPFANTFVECIFGCCPCAGPFNAATFMPLLESSCCHCLAGLCFGCFLRFLLSSLRQAKIQSGNLRRVQFHVSPSHLLRGVIA